MNVNKLDCFVCWFVKCSNQIWYHQNEKCCCMAFKKKCVDDHDHAKKNNFRIVESNSFNHLYDTIGFNTNVNVHFLFVCLLVAFLFCLKLLSNDAYSKCYLIFFFHKKTFTHQIIAVMFNSSPMVMGSIKRGREWVLWTFFRPSTNRKIENDCIKNHYRLGRKFNPFNYRGRRNWISPLDTFFSS